MFPKLLVAGHLLCREINEVWESQGDQSFLLLGLNTVATFMLELDKSSTCKVSGGSKSVKQCLSLYLFLSAF